MENMWSFGTRLALVLKQNLPYGEFIHDARASHGGKLFSYACSP